MLITNRFAYNVARIRDTTTEKLAPSDSDSIASG